MFTDIGSLFHQTKVDLLTIGDIEHDYSVCVKFEGSADRGKTAAMVGTMLELVNFLGYRSDEVYGNIWVDMEGYNQLDNAGMRLYLRKLLKEGIRHNILMMDEIDSIYPSRGFKDKLQTDEVLKLNQMTKTENWFLSTHHLGSSIDKIVRDTTNISVEPTYIPEHDLISLEIINAVDCDEELVRRELYPASEIFRRYRRWEPTR